MNIHVVIGANNGDEGKGTITARIAQECQLHNEKVLNVLTNGGAQRAHTTVINGKRIVNKHIGSGVHLGAATLFAPTFIIDPVAYRAESYYKLNVYRDIRCYWVTPFDVLANLFDQSNSGKTNTCGMGIWKTIVRFNTSLWNLRFDQFMQFMDDDRRNYLLEIVKWYKYKGYSGKFFEDETLINGLIDHFLDDCTYFLMATTPVDVCKVGTQAQTENEVKLLEYTDIIFENGQGLGIEDDGTDNIYRTPSKAGLSGISNLILDNKYWLSPSSDKVCIHYVSRTYDTRHGEDPSFKHIKRSKLSSYVQEDKTNHYTIYQGEFKFGILNNFELTERILGDLKNAPDYFKNAIHKDIVLDLTHCDEIDPGNIVIPGLKINRWDTDNIITSNII